MESKEQKTTFQFFTFILGNEIFAMDITKVREVLEFGPVTMVPQMPAMMKGVINLRGSVVPVIDLRLKFGMAETEPTVNTCIIIIELIIEDQICLIGALVDSVREVLDLDSNHVEPPPKIGTTLNTDFIEGMGKVDGEFLIILNIEKIFSSDDIVAIRQNSDVDIEMEEAV